MIRIRTSKGEVIELEGPGNFVEIVDPKSKKIALALVQVKAGEILQFTADGKMSEQYQRMFPGAEFCSVTKVG